MRYCRTCSTHGVRYITKEQENAFKFILKNIQKRMGGLEKHFPKGEIEL